METKLLHTVSAPIIAPRHVGGMSEVVYDAVQLMGWSKAEYHAPQNSNTSKHLMELAKALEIYRRVCSKGVSVSDVYVDMPVSHRETGDILTDIDVAVFGYLAGKSFVVHAEVPPRDGTLRERAFRTKKNRQGGEKFRQLEESTIPYPDEWWMMQHKGQERDSKVSEGSQDYQTMQRFLKSRNCRLDVVPSELRANGVVEFPGSLGSTREEIERILEYVSAGPVKGEPGVLVHTSNPQRALAIPFRFS